LSRSKMKSGPFLHPFTPLPRRSRSPSGRGPRRCRTSGESRTRRFDLLQADPGCCPRRANPWSGPAQGPARDADPRSPHREIAGNRVRRVDPEKLREEDAVPPRPVNSGGRRMPAGGDAQVGDPDRGGCFRPRTAAGTGSIPCRSFSPRTPSARKPRSSLSAISSRRRVGVPSASNGSAPDPPGSSGSSSIVTAPDATFPPTFPANIDFPWRPGRRGTTGSAPRAARPPRRFRDHPVLPGPSERTAPSILSARVAPSSAIADASSPRSDRATPNPYPVCPSPAPRHRLHVREQVGDPPRRGEPREWNRETVAIVSRSAAVRTRFTRGSPREGLRLEGAANSPSPLPKPSRRKRRTAGGPSPPRRVRQAVYAASGSDASAQKNASSTSGPSRAASPRKP